MASRGWNWDHGRLVSTGWVSRGMVGPPLGRGVHGLERGRRRREREGVRQRQRRRGRERDSTMLKECMTCINILYVLYSWKFSSGGNFHQFRHLLLLAKILSTNFLFCVNDYIEDMVTFTALVKIYSTKYFCSTKVW